MKNFFKKQDRWRWTIRLINVTLICLIIALLFSINPLIQYFLNIAVKFLLPVIISIIFAMATYPLILHFKIKKKWNSSISKLVSILIVLFTIIAFFAILIPQIIILAQNTIPKLQLLQNFQLKTPLGNYSFDIQNWIKLIDFTTILNSIANFGSNMLFILIMYLFIVIDIERIRAILKKIILISNHDNFIKFSKTFNLNFNNYIKALVSYSGVAVVYYTLWILLLSLPWTYTNILSFQWYLIGILFGAFVIIPYVGSILGVVVTSLMMLKFGNNAFLTMLIGLTIATQIDINVIQLKIIGSKLKLNPLVILLSLMLSSSIFGFSGILITPLVLVFIKSLIDVYAKKIDYIYNHTQIQTKKEDSNNEDV